LAKLEYLYLRHTKVTNAGLSHLVGLPSLVTLDISHTQVDDAGFAQLKRLASLRNLSLSEDQLSDVVLAHLRGLHLKNLTIVGTRRGYPEVAERLPGVMLSRSE
jgi:Leucine-rich repeat (LRR) protein